MLFADNCVQHESPGKLSHMPHTVVISLQGRCSVSVEGYCRGIAAGNVNVAWNIGDCTNNGRDNVGDSWTGWGTTVRIIVEELYVEDADNVII